MKPWIALALLLAVAGPTSAQEPYPTRPIKMVVPFPAGGPTDIFSRIISSKVAKILGQPIVIDNRAGAAGIVGTELVAKSPPDGYTFLFGTAATHAINATLYKKLPYDPLRDFEIVAFVGATPFVLLAPPSMPGDVQQFIGLVKANPNKYTYASAGSGTTTHLAGAMLRNATGIDVVHVPYKGSAPALQDVISGQVNFMFESFGFALGHIQAGRVRAVAVASPKRSALAPQVPTFSEAGVGGFEISTWNVVAVPRNTPKPIVDQLNAAINKALADAGVREQLAKLGFEMVDNSTPASATATVKGEIEKWGKAVVASGATVES